MQTYLSNSTLQSAAKCMRQAFYNRHTKTYPPAYRSAAAVKGIAAHAAISTLHDCTVAVEPGVEFDLAIDMEEGKSDVPVQWGVKGRDWHVEQGRKVIEWYWKVNGPDGFAPIDVRSTERWFYLEIDMPDGTTEWIRGRFDLILGEDGQMVLRENKTGAMKPDVDELMFDPQCLLEALGMKKGFVAIGDIAYIAPDHENYHIHKWVHDHDNIYKCSICELEAEHFGVFPAKVVLYHVPSLMPDFKGYYKWTKFIPDKLCPHCKASKLIVKSTKVVQRLDIGQDYSGLEFVDCATCGTRFETRGVDLKTKTKFNMFYHPPYKPRANPAYEIEFTPQNINTLMTHLHESIAAYRACEKSGVWPQSRATGWMSPCRLCNHRNHCSEMQVCSVKHDEGENDDSD